MSAFGYRKPSDLPRLIPVFPLSGALLFPRGRLPLNIFEPRYLNMIDDALSGARLIGMIQPESETTDKARPALAPIGCAGRIVSFSETDDGRYLIVLAGICRFAVAREPAIATPYRQVEAGFDPFAADLEPAPPVPAETRRRLVSALEGYLDRNRFTADVRAASEAPIEDVIHAIAASCPFSLAEKQALLEARDLQARCDTLVSLLEQDEDSGWIQ